MELSSTSGLPIKPTVARSLRVLRIIRGMWSKAITRTVFPKILHSKWRPEHCHVTITLDMQYLQKPKRYLKLVQSIVKSTIDKVILVDLATY